MKQMAKKITLTILVLAFAIGCTGSFISVFNMGSYIEFLKGFMPFYTLLVTSIGTNSAIKKLKETTKNDETGQ